MSSYLAIYIKEKDKHIKEQKMPNIAWFGTSVARELANELNSLSYTMCEDFNPDVKLTDYDLVVDDKYIETYKVLSETIINEAIKFYEKEVLSLEKEKTEILKQNDKYLELSAKATSVEVAEGFLEKTQDVSHYDEEIDAYKYLMTKWEFILEIFYNIEDNFELVYLLN